MLSYDLGMHCNNSKHFTSSVPQNVSEKKGIALLKSGFCEQTTSLVISPGTTAEHTLLCAMTNGKG